MKVGLRRIRLLFLVFLIALSCVDSTVVFATTANIDTDICILTDGTSSEEYYFVTSRFSSWNESTYGWCGYKSGLGRCCYYYQNSSADDGCSVKMIPFSYLTGRGSWTQLYYASTGDGTYAEFTNVPVFKSEEDAVVFRDTGVLDLDDLDLRFCPPGYTFNTSGGLTKEATEGYEEDIGYPLNFEFHNYNWAMSKDRWCTWSTGEFDVDEDLRCEIYYNCQVSQYYEAFSEAVYFTVPKRALSFSDNTAVSCLSNSKSMSDMCTDQILPYLREHNDTEYDIDGGLTGILKLRTLQNLEVWARFYYVDASDYKHYGNWVKWTKDGVKVLKDKSQLEDDEEEDNTEDSQKKSSTDGYVKTDDGTDPDKTSDTEDIEGVPTSIEDDSSSSGSSGGSSGSSSDSGSGFSITDALEFLGKILSGLAEFLIGAIKTFVSFIADLLSGVVEIVESVSDVSNVFGVLLGWLPLNLQVVLSIAVAVAVFLRILRR